MRPGHRLAHVWLEKDGRQVSTLDLTRLDRFTVFTNGPAGKWADAAASAAEAGGLTIDVVSVGEDYRTTGDRWATVSGLKPGGALIVRPDQHVAWRGADAVADPAATLAQVLSTVLGKPVTQTVPA
ncbi:hypothetical protein ACFSTD_19805 [Novosphingobium colocasiae]